jgi:AcrR family transcriptional regulator
MRTRERRSRGGRRRGRPPRRLESPDVRAALVEAARRLFAGRGFHEVGTREIARAAGVNPAMIHYYFGDKEGLYKEMLGEAIEGLVTRAGEIASVAAPAPVAKRAPRAGRGNQSAAESPRFRPGQASGVRTSPGDAGNGGDAGRDGPLAELLRLYVGTLMRDPWIPRLMIREVLSDGAPFRREFVERFAARAATLIPDLVRRERAAGRLRADLDPVLTTLSLIGMAVFPFLALPVAREVFGIEPNEEFRDRLVAHTTKLFQHGAAAKESET